MNSLTNGVNSTIQAINQISGPMEGKLELIDQLKRNKTIADGYIRGLTRKSAETMVATARQVQQLQERIHNLELEIGRLTDANKTLRGRLVFDGALTRADIKSMQEEGRL